MSVTDSIANILVMIKNASRAKKEKVDIPSSNMAKAIVEVLKKRGFVKDYKPIEETKHGGLRVYLKTDETGRPAISEIKRISKSSNRIYVDKDNIPFVLGGIGIAVISTSQGVMTDKEARQKKIGGEVICHVW